MHQALYRKWRSKTFDEVYGQEHITSVLKYEVAQGRVSHAYLFCGSRGTGKTSCAKLLAKAVNCEAPKDGNPCGVCDACRKIDAGTATDVLEMDAASNNGVDYIRDIRDEVVYTPAELKYRVYIVDEVHMLSPGAFNALLKTLEEPPAHVIFILATTELHKLPATIISRCQRFDFRRIATPVIAEHLMRISAVEGIELDDDAAALMAKLSLGGMRDAISMLELCSGTPGKITSDAVAAAVGVSTRASVFAAARAIGEHDIAAAFSVIAEIAASSVDMTVFWQDLTALYRDLLVIKSIKDAAGYLELPKAEVAECHEIAKLFSLEVLIAQSGQLDAALARMQRGGGSRRLCAELTFVRMCDQRLENTPDTLAARISELEDRVTRLQNTQRVVSVPDKQAPDISKDEAQTVQTANKKSAPASAGDPVPVQKKNEDKRVLTEIDTWAEITDKVSKKNKAIGSFLQNTAAYRGDDGTVQVRVKNKFFADMLSSEDNLALIADALSVVEGKPVFTYMISVKLIEEKNDKNEDIFSQIN